MQPALENSNISRCISTKTLLYKKKKRSQGKLPVT